MSNKHVQVFKTSCTTSNCEGVNCADPTDPNVSCPARTAVENTTTIPDTPEHTTAVCRQYDLQNSAGYKRRNR